ncbi:MAG: tetratricopeptide repeat protein, partial [Acidobacteria bacterium]|nr:tetratricopeptide repeat protein [Acidobacteriota bacterium]
EVAGRLRKLNAGNFLAWYYLGVGQAGQAGLEATGAAEAERALRRVIRLNPGFPPAYFQLGKLLLERGETAGAIRRLSRAVELKPDYAEAHFLLARAFRKTGDAGRWQEELEIHRKLLAEEQARKRPHIEVQLALPE